MVNQLTNETIGITAEKIICDIGNIPFKASNRTNKEIEEQLKPLIIKIFTFLSKPIKYDSNGEIDFILENMMTLSVKTIKNSKYSKVCPQLIGQTTKKRFLEYFQSPLEPNVNNCKEFIEKNIAIIVREEWNHLFSCDFLMYIFFTNVWNCKIFKKNLRCPFTLPINRYPDDIKSPFTFTRVGIKWKESTTIKYNGKSIAEMQIHRNRDCVKFRFNMNNIIE